jgi:signal transduction histidine kinase
MGGEADAAVDAAVAGSFVEALTEVAPRLAGDAAGCEAMRVRALAVLAVTHDRLRGAPATPVAPDVGAMRARTGVHPSESLRAAGLLFRQALPPLVEHHADLPCEQVALVLHEVIDTLVVPAAVSYVEVLLGRISDANRDERRRVARDLHDSTSHGIGTAIQGLDLALHVLAAGQTPDVDRLRATRQVLLDTLNDVRGMSTRLRDVVGERSLGQALRAYLDLAVPVRLAATVTGRGQEDHPLPGHVKEESYLIVREAVRNCLLHAPDATRLDVEVVVADGRLQATVTDDGPGFDPAAVDGTRSVGLASMRERAEGLGGSVAIEAGPGGVRMALTVPLATVAG